MSTKKRQVYFNFYAIYFYFCILFSFHLGKPNITTWYTNLWIPHPVQEVSSRFIIPVGPFGTVAHNNESELSIKPVLRLASCRPACTLLYLWSDLIRGIKNTLLRCRFARSPTCSDNDSVFDVFQILNYVKKFLYSKNQVYTHS